MSGLNDFRVNGVLPGYTDWAYITKPGKYLGDWIEWWVIDRRSGELHARGNASTRARAGRHAKAVLAALDREARGKEA